MQVRGVAGVPSQNVAAVALNVTGTEAADGGFVTVFPGPSPRPLASNLNLERTGQTVSNHVIVPVAPDGTVRLYTHAGTHLVVDVFGWYTADNPAVPLSADGLFLPRRPSAGWTPAAVSAAATARRRREPGVRAPEARRRVGRWSSTSRPRTRVAEGS